MTLTCRLTALEVRRSPRVGRPRPALPYQRLDCMEHGLVNRDAGVVVTGVSSGIGAATMRELLGAGYQVFGTIRRARETAAVQAAGGFPIIMDVTMRTSVLRARETVARALDGRPLAGLVNNAGVPGVGP